MSLEIRLRNAWIAGESTQILKLFYGGGDQTPQREWV